MGDIGCLSFNANKIITTGSGGAIITSNRNLYLKAQYLANQAKDDTFNYIHNECGYNYKMNGMTAALGISQLKRIKKKIAVRKNIYQRYLFNFKKQKNIDVLSFQKSSKMNYWINIISFRMLNFNQINKLSQKLFQKNIETRRIWRPLNLQSYLKKFETYNITNANKFYSNSLCVPSDDNLSISDIDKISNYIIKYSKDVKPNRNL